MEYRYSLVARTFFKNGQIASECFSNNGYLEGKFTEFWYTYHNMIYKESNYIDGKLYGLSICYHDKNIIKSTFTYTNDQMDGVCKTFYKNGDVCEIYYCKNGIMRLVPI